MPDSLQRSFSANHPLLISQAGHCSAVVSMEDDPTRRGYRMLDFYQTQIITPSQYWCVFGKVESLDMNCRAIKFVTPDTKHGQCPKVLVLADGAGGSFIR